MTHCGIIHSTGRFWPNDPVHQNLADGKWWFWCEDWASAEGPFEDEALCREALAKYAAQLYGE